MHCRNRGIALIQILIITAILATIALYMTQSARQQVNMASWANDKALATLQAHSAEAEVTFALLTSPLAQQSKAYVGSEQPPEPTLQESWNFYRQPFAIGAQTQINLQDQAGLLNVHAPNIERFRRSLLMAGIDERSVGGIFTRLLDWQDIDTISRPSGRESGVRRDGPMPDVREWLLQNTLEVQQFEQLAPLFTVYRSQIFNPFNSPRPLVEALAGLNAANEVFRLRGSEGVTAREFSDITGLRESEDVQFYTSDTLGIKIVATVGESQARLYRVIKISPYQVGKTPPYTILQTKGI